MPLSGRSSQERQKRKSGSAAFALSPEKQESKRCLKSKQQKIDSGNRSKTLPTTPETEVSCKTGSVRVPAVMKPTDQGSKPGAGGSRVVGGGPKAISTNREPSIFDDTSENEPETEDTYSGLEPEKVHCNIDDVRKLTDDVYKPFGSRSRAGSTADSDAAFCKGGPSIECGKAVYNRDEALQCDKCDQWFHCACQGVPPATYRVAGLHKTLSWLCAKCKASIRSPTTCCKALEERVRTLETTIQAQLSLLVDAHESHTEKLIGISNEQAAAMENTQSSTCRL